jgi:predicted phage terminase large subunit-like protein
MKEPSLFCSGVDNARTGAHPDVIIMDDLVSERNVSTPDQIEKVKNHYKYSLSLLEIGALQIVVGTRYHFHDLYGELLKKNNLDTYVRAAILPDGTLFFPTRLTHTYLEGMRSEQGTYIYSCQYMLNPIDDSDATFKKSWVQYYENIPMDENGIRIPLTQYILVDLAISETKRADYTVVMRVGISENNKLYLLHYYRGRFNPQETIETIFKAYDDCQGSCRSVGIESVAFQKVMIFLIRNEMRRRQKYMPVKELKADANKQRRIRGLVPMFENGDIFIKHEHVELENELLEFPFNEHDDVIDSLAYIIQIQKYAIHSDVGSHVYKQVDATTGY